MYGTMNGFDVYHTERGRDVSALTDPVKAAALIVASEWIDARYRNSFPGTKVGLRDQIDEWPRYRAFDKNGDVISSASIPVEVNKATYEAALRQVTSPGSLSLDWTPPKYKRVSVDGAVSAEYAMFGDAGDVQTRFQIIDEILSPILTGESDFSILSGSVMRA